MPARLRSSVHRYARRARRNADAGLDIALCVPPRGELRDARDAGNDGLDEPGVCRDPFSEGCAGPLDDGEGYGGAAAPAPTASTSRGCGRERRLRRTALAADLLATLWAARSRQIFHCGRFRIQRADARSSR